MATMIHDGNDVVSFLKGQHRQVKAMFERVISAKGEERERSFYELRRMLAVHETAEEEIVHPAARRAIPNGDTIVDARLAEENKAKQALTELETMSVDSPASDMQIRMLQKDVVAHAEAQEREDFDRLGASLDPARLARMKKAIEIAEAIAPTRPHAGVESAIGNLFAGPFVSMLDRSRDFISGKTAR